MERPVIVAELGSGGMAEVFLAMRRGMGGFVKLVVVKRIREGVVEGDGVSMFHDEARISARLNHPNVVQTHEVGFDGDHYRLEMEFLDGQPLHRIVNRAKKAGRAIPPEVSVAVMRGVLAGLRYAHELCDYDGSPLNIVHRDVSPQNIFVTYDGHVKLVDFGIAKMAGQSSVTQVGMVKGKVRYMAPEQATGRPVDGRADVFAAGVVLWQLLVGRGYWGDTPDIAIFHRLALNDLPPRPREVNPEVPEELDRIVTRAVAADPRDRFASAQELHDALEAYAPAGNAGERTMGNLAAELFADVRQAIRSEIEKAAARPAPADSEPPTQAIAMWSDSSSSETRRAHSDGPVSKHVVRPAEAKGLWLMVAAPVLAVVVAAVALQLLVLAPRPRPSAAPPVAASVEGSSASAPVGRDGDPRGGAPPATATPEPAEPPEPAAQAEPAEPTGHGDVPSAPRFVSSGRVPPPHGGVVAAGRDLARPPTPPPGIVDAGAPAAPAVSKPKPGLVLEEGDPWDAG